MCEFFSAIVTRSGDVLFTEADSHETIIDRAKLRDADRYLRHWVRVELKPNGDGWHSLFLDESEAPAWWIEDAPVFINRVLKIADRVRPAHTRYEAIQQPAWAAYLAIKAPWAAYEAIERPTYAAYEASKQQAWAAYLAIKQAGLAEYQTAIARITGYVSA